MAESAWTSDWRARIRNRLHTLGFESLQEFLRTVPEETYQQLSQLVGESLPSGGWDVAPVQIQTLQMEDFRDSPAQLREVATDSLTRLIRQHLKRGWNCGVHATFNRACVASEWISLISGGGTDARLASLAEFTWKTLCERNPPDVWIPRNNLDSIIVSVFDDIWNEI